jgi:hypothetical protein
MVRRKENLIVEHNYILRAAGIMAIALGAKGIGSINSEIRNHMMRMLIERND